MWQSSSVRTANGFALLGDALADDDGDEIRFVVERKPAGRGVLPKSLDLSKDLASSRKGV